MIQANEVAVIGQQIRDRREALGMTQTQLAERSGIGQSAIAVIESGKRQDIQLSTISRLAKGLECDSLTWLHPRKSHQDILDELSTRLANQIIAESSGSTALELQLPNAEARKEEFQKVKDYILKQKKSFLWRQA